MDARQAVLKYEAEVSENGTVELNLPFPAGARITVFVFEQNVDEFSNLLSASHSSLDFWDNPLDDADWNNA